MSATMIVPAREGRGFQVKADQLIRISTPKGAQAADFFAFNAHNTGEWLSANHTWVTTFCVKPREGDTLISRGPGQCWTVPSSGSDTAEV